MGRSIYMNCHNRNNETDREPGDMTRHTTP